MSAGGESVMERLRRMRIPAGENNLTTRTTTKEQTMNGQQPGQSGQQPPHFYPAAPGTNPASAPPMQPAQQPMQPMQPGPGPMMMPQQPATMAPPVFAPQPMQALPQATGVAVQIEVETPSGKATAFLHYGPEWASSSAAMKQLIGALQMAGFPVKAWTPKGQRGGGW